MKKYNIYNYLIFFHSLPIINNSFVSFGSFGCIKYQYYLNEINYNEISLLVGANH